MQVIQAQQVSTTRDQQAVSDAMAERDEVARVAANGDGIYGYASDRRLSPEERKFKIMLLNLGAGISRETAKELF